MSDSNPSRLIDPLDHEFNGVKIGKIWNMANDASFPKPTRERLYPPYNALVVHPEVERRQALLDRLLEAFRLSIVNAFHSSDQSASVLQSFREAMPDPQQYPDAFAYFVRGRCHGVLEMLRLYVSYVSKGSKVVDALSLAAKIGGKEIVNGIPASLNSLSAQDRDRTMHERVAHLRDLQQLWAFLKPQNVQLYSKSQEYFSRFSPSFQAVIDAFTDHAGAFASQEKNPDYAQAQWFNVLLDRLLRFDLKRSDTREALEALAQKLREASDGPTFRTAINNFGQIIQ